ncbi:MAG: hypothetical protein L3J98_11175 [Gammaproteobacteria bacterium]|nr:hypothetical protein [Gammaproteobacteria bacterium]MCF6260700.1 hypothetical protein [Gammaproteobacteria bacterium]
MYITEISQELDSIDWGKPQSHYPARGRAPEIYATRLNKACEFGNEKTNIEKIFNFIYEDNAKPRIITLFVMLFSIITILSIAGGQNINTVISSYSSIEYIEIITLYGIILFVCIASGVGASSIYKESKKIFILLSLEYCNESDKNPETIKYIIRDLNNYHEFKKTHDNKIILTTRINNS